MKLIKKSLEKDGFGTLTMVPEEAEDLWHVYNLLQTPDLLKATTIRRVVTESNTGSTAKTSHKITLTIQVDSLFFDTQAATLRVNGKNVVENKFVKMGGFHTLDLELNRAFTITKECWGNL
jgi:protein pelota